jgi:hypothetical protein
MARLTEEYQIQTAIVPIDLAAGANAGDWVSMKNYDTLDIIVICDAGTAGEDPVLTLDQATAVAGTGAKALNIARVDSKVGAQTGIGQFTKNTQTPGGTYTDLVSGEAENLFVIHVEGQDLDKANGFDCVRISVPDTGATAGKIGAAIYVLGGARYAGQFPPSAIVD